MSSTSVLSPRQKILSSIIIIFFTLIVFNIHDGFPEVVLFLCGVSIGVILTKEFFLGYNTGEATDSGQQEETQSGTVSADEYAKQTLISPQVSKYLAIGMIGLVVLIGGLWGAGTFVGIGPLAESNEISGTVYDSDGDPASGAIVEIENADGGIISLAVPDSGTRVSTNEAGEYRFELEEGGGSYTIRVNNASEEYSSKTVTPPNTTVDFGEQTTQPNNSDSGLFSSLLGGLFAGDDSESDDQEATLNDSGDTGGSGSGTDGGEQEQVFQVLNGTVVDSNGDPIPFANVTIEYGNGDQLTQEQETGQDGRYRYEDVPYEGDIQNITLVWKAHEEGYIQENPPQIDLGRLYENEERGIERDIMLIQEDTNRE